VAASVTLPVTIGEAAYEELEALLALYRHLHPNDLVPQSMTTSTIYGNQC